MFFIAFPSPTASCVKTFRLSTGWSLDFFFFLLAASPALLDISLVNHSSFVSAAMIQGSGQGFDSTFIPGDDWNSTPERPDCRALSVRFKFH